MKQPLMLTPSWIPPAQAEALYDASLAESARPAQPDAGAWPGEDWEDDLPSPYRAKPPPEANQGRAAQH